MSEYHKRMRRGSVNKKDRFPAPPPQQAAPKPSFKPQHPPSSGGPRPALFELRRSSDKENAPDNSGGGSGGAMGLLIPMLGRDDDSDRGHTAAAALAPPMPPPPPTSMKAQKRDSISSNMSLCFDDTDAAAAPSSPSSHDAASGVGVGRLEPVAEASPPPFPMAPKSSGVAVASRPSSHRAVPSIPPRMGSTSPPKVSLARRPTRVSGFKRRDITPPAPLFGGAALGEDGSVAMAADDTLPTAGGGNPLSPAKALRMSSFSTHGPPAPGLSSLFGDEMDEESSSAPTDRSSPHASPRKLPFSMASSSTPRSSPKPSNPYAAPQGGAGARGMFQSPHWSNAVHINPFSPVPTEYLNGSRDEDDDVRDAAEGDPGWAPPAGSVNGTFYSARGSPLGPSRAAAGAADAAVSTVSKRKTPRRPLGAQHSEPTADSSTLSAVHGSRNSLEFAPAAPALSVRRDADSLAIDTSMESDDCGAAYVKISPTDVMSFPPPPTPAKKSGRPMPIFGDTSGSPPRSRGGSPAPSRERRGPPPLNRLGPGRSFDMDDDLENMVSPRARPHLSRRGSDEDSFGRSPLPQCTQSRFEQDFQVVGQLGTGSFGTVHKCISRLDGCLYAVKVMKRPVRGELDRRQTLKEVHALAALCSQADASAFHIVRYHQAWMEDNLLHIQTELCTSTLPHEMAAGMLIDEDRRFKLLREMLLALELIHKNEMVHLDIKPENIFIKNDQFKLGDFGLASKLTSSSDVEEGDSRYMSRELLSGDTSDLTKCDIFSLGATMYEVCLGRTLPSDGPEWADMRSGKLSVLRRTHPAMVEMVREMMQPDPARRPCASALLTRRQLLSDEQKLLLLEQNRAKEASMALAAQEEKFKKMCSTKPSAKKKLLRSTSCQLY